MVTVRGGWLCLGNEADGDARSACELWLISGHSPQKSASFLGYYSSILQADSRSVNCALEIVSSLHRNMQSQETVD